MTPSGEPAAWDPAVAELAGPLRRYLTRYVGEATLAEDLLQETLIRIARGLPGFAGRSSLQTWAFSVATRVAADHFRHPANRVRLADVDETAEVPSDDAALEEPLVLDEMNACIRQVVDSLPADYRAAVVLHEFEGMTAARVADISGCTVATAKIRIHRGRARLKAALSQQCQFYRGPDDVLRCDRKA